MRPLTEDETQVVFEKLSKFLGENIRLLIDRPDGIYCFRFHRNRVFYIGEKNMKMACNIPREELLSFGTCFGRFTKTNKFRLDITALDFIAPYAKHKLWVKPSAEQQFLYGHNILKSGLARISETTTQYQGVIICSMNDIPLGFGVAAKSAQDCRTANPMTVVAYHQADIGEYIRSEDLLS